MQLAGLAVLVNGGSDFAGKTIRLGADIDLANNLWVPIGTSDHPFKGRFEGEGYTINGMTVSGSYAYAGLFGMASGSECYINNLGVTGSINVGGGDYPYVGGLAGGLYDASVSNCWTNVAITLNAINCACGGIVGIDNGKVKNCYAAGTIADTATDSDIYGVCYVSSGACSYSYSLYNGSGDTAHPAAATNGDSETPGHTECCTFTSAQGKGTEASTVISETDKSYANTSDLLTALNGYVKDDNGLCIWTRSASVNGGLPTLGTNKSYKVVVGGITMRDGDYLAVGASAVTRVKPDDNYANFNIADNVPTLTLHNYTFDGTGGTVAKAVRAECDLELVLEGKNSVTGAGKDACYSYYDSRGVSADGELGISGDGELTAVGGKVVAPGSGVSVYCYGLFADGKISIRGGTVTAVSKYAHGIQAGWSAGVESNTGVYISGGRLTASSDGTSNSSYGIFEGNGKPVVITGGVVIAQGKTAINGALSYPASGYTVTASYNTDGTSPEAEYIPGNTGEYRYLRIEPESCSVTLPAEQAGYVLKAKAGSSSPVEYGGSYTFTFALDAAYANYTAVIRVNGRAVALSGGEYTISNITENKEVTVELTENTQKYCILFFETNGGKAMPGLFREEGAVIDLSAYVPTRSGYTFTGWFADAALTSKTTGVTLTNSATVYAGWQKGPFSDVSEKDWFYEDVIGAYENGLMEGTGDGEFSPYLVTTRGMIATIVYRMEGEPAVNGTCPFPDVKSGSYCEKAIIWGAANGILKGYDTGNFGPEDNITREQLAAIMWRYAEFKGYDISASADLAEFSDAGRISGYAVVPMHWAVANKLVTGRSSGGLEPRAEALRCETAAVLNRFCALFVK